MRRVEYLANAYMRSPTARASRQRSTTRVHGFTIVELLVGTTLSLLLILVLAQAFAVVSETVSNSRAVLELAGQLRSTSARLQADMDGIPGPIVPFQPSGAGRGYVEYGDGPVHDLSQVANGDSSLGDYDDYLMFTAESVDAPFSGRFNATPATGTLNSNLLHSHQAEIAWWTRLNDLDGDNIVDPGETFTVYRRVLLIRPDLNGVAGFYAELPSSATWYSQSSQADLQQMYNVLMTINNETDISWHIVRIESGNNVRLRVVANSVSDLSLRQNRFAHDIIATINTTVTPAVYGYNGLPTPPPVVPPPPYWFCAGFGIANLQAFQKAGDRIGEDVMLTNVLAFDVRAFDPLAAVSVHPGADGQWGIAGVDDDNNSPADDVAEAGWPGSDDEAVTPGDVSYGSATVGAPPAVQLLQIGTGAFVDLNYLGKMGLNVNQIPASNFRLSGGPIVGTVSITGPVYDTWALDYEFNQFDDDGDGTVDEAIDGLDSITVNGTFVYGADDALERETSPPYPVDLRGLQVRIRVLDRDTRQVRQATVSSDYTTEERLAVWQYVRQCPGSAFAVFFWR